MVRTDLRWRRRIVNILWVLVIGGLLWFLFRSQYSPLFFVIYMQHLNNQQERCVLYHVDHTAIASQLRDVAEQHEWKRFDMSASDPAFPPALRLLKPLGIWSFPDYAELEFGGPFGDIGLRAFRPGLAGYGTKKVGDGIWFYSEDGSCPRP